MIVLTIDIGGTYVKMLASNQREPRQFESGPILTPLVLVRKVKQFAADWTVDAISIGYPGVVVRERVVEDPRNLGVGWVGFDFAKAFGCPVKLINDAAMQALGSYTGGRMLFLGLGTGLGSAIIDDGRIEPMELSDMAYRKGRNYEDYLGAAGLERLGETKWRRHVWAVVKLLRTELEPDYVVLCGGNAGRLETPPDGVRFGDNSDAFLGGFALWRKDAKGGRLMPHREPATMIVAHPDDETLWAGGFLLENTKYSWTIVTICRGSDSDRAEKFLRAMKRLGGTGVMADLDDGPDQRPLEAGLIESAILSLLPRTDYELLVTHSPFGEYTRHRRHEETSRAVTELWARGQLKAPELWLFAYEDGDKQYLPRAIERAHVKNKLDEGVWKEKADIIRNTYGFESDSWETRATPGVEAFWCFNDVQAHRDWFEKEQEYVKGSLT